MSKANDIQVLTETLYMEARGEPLAGIIAVANVILNRKKQRKWYSKILNTVSIANVCKKPWQFSCWNKGDQCDTVLPKAKKTSYQWKLCSAIAEATVNNELADNTGGADHYFANSMKKAPSWAAAMKFTKQIGNHKFYKA